MKVPLSTICEQSSSYSSREPSTQWIALGWVSWAILSTHFRRCSFVLKGSAALRVAITDPACFAALMTLSLAILIFILFCERFSEHEPGPTHWVTGNPCRLLYVMPDEINAQ